MVYSLKGVVCSGQTRIHNSKVGGSSPAPATDKINNITSAQLLDLGVLTPSPLLNNLPQGISGIKNYSNFTANQFGQRNIRESVIGARG